MRHRRKRRERAVRLAPDGAAAGGKFNVCVERAAHDLRKIREFDSTSAGFV
jgi:hypothetical protein